MLPSTPLTPFSPSKRSSSFASINNAHLAALLFFSVTVITTWADKPWKYRAFHWKVRKPKLKESLAGRTTRAPGAIIKSLSRLERRKLVTPRRNRERERIFCSVLCFVSHEAPRGRQLLQRRWRDTIPMGEHARDFPWTDTRSDDSRCWNYTTGSTENSNVGFYDPSIPHQNFTLEIIPGACCTLGNCIWLYERYHFDRRTFYREHSLQNYSARHFTDKFIFLITLASVKIFMAIFYRYG